MAEKPVIGILALQGDVLEHREKLQAAGAKVRQVRRSPDFTGLSGLVIPGGESTTMMKLLGDFGLQNVLQRELEAGLPVWGTCAGMILLAHEILSGRSDQLHGYGCIDMVVRRNAFGSQVDSYEENLVVADVADAENPLRGVFIRAPWVEAVGEGVRILAESARVQVDGCRPIVAVSQGSALATSFHPELDPDLRLEQYFLREFVGASI